MMEKVCKKAELLAPAGNYKCLKAAINAGADAVYLAGNKFGARAYADNFTEEEICSAIRYAHLFGSKIYLTLNTLLKDAETEEVYGYVKPLYEAGLDGVIVQDFGVLNILRNAFPELELHASTQMTVTGAYGAKLLKEYGVSRIVPARELSLAEIKNIKQEADIEVETFIHGAMCYCYSGQCLFSSILGGRSGNRGRCAGPCRLPYQVRMGEKYYKSNPGKEQYPLSLKDLCTLELIPQLLDAGIDSFKIEGRMKSAEYVAGVTAMYRKYIDYFYETQNEYKRISANSTSPEIIKRTTARNTISKAIIAPQDLNIVRKLYVRSELEDGYYFKHNGASMITLDKPCYETGTEADFAQIRAKYIDKDKKLSISGQVILKKDKPLSLEVRYEDMVHMETGNPVMAAKNRPLEEEQVKKQITKTGNTVFSFSHLDVQMDADVFAGIKELNDMRRKAIEALEEQILKERTIRKFTGTRTYHDRQVQTREPEKNPFVNHLSKTPATGWEFHLSVKTMEQFKSLVYSEFSDYIHRLYLDFDLFTENKEHLIKEIHRIQTEKQFFICLALPGVMRENTVKKIKENLDFSLFNGILAGNLEALQLCREEIAKLNMDILLISDYNLYSFNQQSVAVLKEWGISSFTLPYELNSKEIRHLTAGMDENFELPIYGYIPLMESANCIWKTFGWCGNSQGSNGQNSSNQDNNHQDTNHQYNNDQPGQCHLIDRYHKEFPVQSHCGRCENTIYNCLPLSLHGARKQLADSGITGLRLSFTIESGQSGADIFAFFVQTFCQEKNVTPPYQEFTKGHLKRGVE